MTTKLTQRMRRRRSFILSVAFGLLLGVTGGPALAEEIPEASPQGAGLQAASWVLTIPYGAVKSAYAIGGGIVGSLAWVVTGGSTDVAKSVWIPSMTGDYIVQPQHLTGEKTLYFVGRSSDEPAS
ncbi:MAG: hypothetical protein OEV77_14265 [Nitrospira sp.]|nr:hypothetical protein [Nitrospira sp.]